MYTERSTNQSCKSSQIFCVRFWFNPDQDTTFLTKPEILRVFKRYCEIQDPPLSPREVTYEALTEIAVSYPELAKCPELKVGQGP